MKRKMDEINSLGNNATQKDKELLTIKVSKTGIEIFANHGYLSGLHENQLSLFG